MTTTATIKSKTSSSQATNGGVAGAITIVAVWGATAAGLDVPAAVASAFTVIISYLVGRFLT